MQRICVVGCSGAGKSTLSKRLADVTGLPNVSLDRHYWQDGWIASSDDAWRATHQSLIEQDRWIIDGTFYSTMEQRLQFADTVIFLDYPRHLCVRRVLWRTVRWWHRSRSEMPGGCRERFDFDFLKYVWGFQWCYRSHIIEAIGRVAEGRCVYILTNDREATALLRQFARD